METGIAIFYEAVTAPMDTSPAAKVPTAAGQPQARPGSAPAGAPWLTPGNVLLWLSLGVVTLWVYQPTLEAMAERWANEPQYSHGFLVPLFAAVILWCRREQAPAGADLNLWGFAWLAGAFLLRFTAAYLYLSPLDGVSILPTLVGLTLLLGGAQALRWAWPALAFLAFMLPLPYGVEMALAHPLRRLATLMSTFALQTLGFPAVAEGNIIHIEAVKLGVIDACSGLGMLMTFFALATAVAILIDRGRFDRWFLVASAVPIAVVVNVVRITLTGVAQVVLGPEAGQTLNHDLAGWLMMPMALAALWLELQFLARLFIEFDDSSPLPLDSTGAGRSALPWRPPAPAAAPEQLPAPPTPLRRE